MKRGLIFLVISTLLFSSCIFFVSTRTETKQKSENIKIVATLFPQYDFAKQVGGDKVEVSLLLTPGTETHTYEPTPQDIVKINNADIFIYTGKYMEPWSEKIASSIEPGIRILDVSKNIQLAEADYDEHKDVEHEEFHTHEYDPHIWLNPENSIQMVKNVTEELCSIDPENSEYYISNSNRYIAEIGNLDSEISQTINNAKSNKIAFGGTFAYAYFVHKYNLEYVSAYDSCGEDTEPSVTNVKKVIDYMNQNNIKVIFFQELSEGRIADAIAKETGAQKLVFHTIHNASQEEINNGETYISLMRKNLENLKIALRQW